MTCKNGHRDLMVEFTNGSVKYFRVYESMYDRAKDAFYSGADKYDFVLGYELVDVKMSVVREGVPKVIYEDVSELKTFVNMRNVCCITVVGKCDGHG